MFCDSLLIRILAIMVIHQTSMTYSAFGRNRKVGRGIKEWSPWSNCSKPCGTGVMHRTRTCRPHRSKCKSTEAMLCNSQTCPGDGRSSLQVQCSKFDGKVLAGATYKWVPFYTGLEECSLNCRAVGYKFYAKLGRLEDGTPCSSTKPGKRVCLSGVCTDIGCDGVIGSGKVEDSCGLCGGSDLTCKLVSGLFTTPSLSHGYNFVTQIPVNASNITVTQLKKDSRNYLALKKLDGSFIINGKHTISPSGEYASAGTTFIYQNNFNSMGEFIKSRGPLNQPIDLMIIYQEPNSGIKYEYRIPVSPADVQMSSLLEQNIASPVHRHSHALPYSTTGNTSLKSNGIYFARHAKPTYSFGRDYKLPGDEGIRNRVRLKRKKFIWKISGFSECSKTCGGGTQSPIMVCVRETNEVVVPDKRCSATENQPLPLKRCNIKPCPPEWTSGSWSTCSVTCGEGLQYREVTCRQEISNIQTVTLTHSTCEGIPPISKKPCSLNPCPPSPHNWQVGQWSQCSSECGVGMKTRTVVCLNGECHMNDRPSSSLECDMGPCNNISHSYWMYTDWSHKCSEDCGKGIQTRRVICYGGHCDDSKKPDEKRYCSTDKKCIGQWFTGPWQMCTGSCGIGEQTRSVICIAHVHGGSIVANDENCKREEKPISHQKCQLPPCFPKWFMADWNQCSKTCDSGIQKRDIKCLDEQLQPSSVCNDSHRPTAYHVCNTNPCKMSDDDCTDKLHNCPTVVQARLCSYNYYNTFCCRSCQKKF